MALSYREIAKMIDHSLLRPTLTDSELWEGCRLAVKYDVASVCIMPYAARQCAELLKGTSVEPSTTIGFPHGGHSAKAKLEEARVALSDGATELDMVVNVSQVLSGAYAAVTAEIRDILSAVRERGAKLKVIFENCYLAREHKLALCQICGELNVDWVKTSTGYGSGGATISDLKLMIENVPPEVQVKAAGGIRTLDSLLEVRALGVTRVGASATGAILDELRGRIG